MTDGLLPADVEHGAKPWKPVAHTPPRTAPPVDWEDPRSQAARMHSLMRFCQDKSVTTVLDVGTSFGTSARAFSLAGCEVTTLDVNDLGAYGYLKNMGNIAAFIADDTHLPIRPGAKFDMVFIDTSHEYEHTKQEIVIFLPLVGRFLGFDDISWSGVSRATSEAGIVLESLGGDIGIWRKP